MSRSGYSDDFGDDYPGQMDLYRNAVKQAVYGKRGQQFLRELLAAIEALPARRLITDELVNEDGEACALGAVFLARGKHPTGLYEDAVAVGRDLGIPTCLAAEIAYMNDEWITASTPEALWDRMHEHVLRLLGPKENWLG